MAYSLGFVPRSIASLRSGWAGKPAYIGWFLPALMLFSCSSAQAAVSTVFPGSLVDRQGVTRSWLSTAALLGPTGDRVIAVTWNTDTDRDQYWVGPSNGGPLTFLVEPPRKQISLGRPTPLTSPLVPDATSRYVASVLVGGNVRVVDTQTGTFVDAKTDLAAAGPRSLYPNADPSSALIPAPDGGFYYLHEARGALKIGVDGSMSRSPITRDGKRRGWLRGRLAIRVSDGERFAAFCQASYTRYNPTRTIPGLVGRFRPSSGRVELHTLPGGSDGRCAISGDGSAVLYQEAAAAHVPASRQKSGLMVWRGSRHERLPASRAWREASVSPQGGAALLYDQTNDSGFVQYVDLGTKTSRVVKLPACKGRAGSPADMKVAWVSNLRALYACRGGVYRVDQSGPGRPLPLPAVSQAVDQYLFEGLTNDLSTAVVVAYVDESEGHVMAVPTTGAPGGTVLTGRPIDVLWPGTPTGGPASNGGAAFAFEQATGSSTVLLSRVGPLYAEAGAKAAFTGTLPGALMDPWPLLPPVAADSAIQG